MLDTSAENRIKYESVESRISPLITRFVVATCVTLNLEALFSAQSPDEYEQIWAYRNTVYEYVETSDDELQRALEIQRLLAAKSSHRVALNDLIIAAVAERHELTLLHYDHEYDLIASVTNQAVEWVVPRGSVS